MIVDKIPWADALRFGGITVKGFVSPQGLPVAIDLFATQRVLGVVRFGAFIHGIGKRAHVLRAYKSFRVLKGQLEGTERDSLRLQLELYVDSLLKGITN